MREHVQDLRAVVRSATAGPAHLVGHSYGAYLCLRLATEDPGLIRSLVLAEPPVFTLFTSSPPCSARILDWMVLTSVLGCRPGAVMAGWPGAAKDRLSADAPAIRPGCPGVRPRPPGPPVSGGGCRRGGGRAARRGHRHRASMPGHREVACRPAERAWPRVLRSSGLATALFVGHAGAGWCRPGRVMLGCRRWRGRLPAAWAWTGRASVTMAAARRGRRRRTSLPGLAGGGPGRARR
jgi:pimeloyl-ACP methyl ester carboxylesterase